ncbi:MAG: GDSL-type esterase/lipase family protein [Steroidobacteraceae bacterium]
MTLFTLAAALLAVAAGASLMARHYYLQRAELRLNPANLEPFSGDNSALPARSGPRIIFFGDSRVNGWTPRPELAGVESIWRGIDGETTAQMKYRFDSDVVDLGPSAVVIEAGINDLIAGAALRRLPQATAAAAENLATMARKAVAAGANVHLMTVVRPGRPPLLRRIVWSDDIYDAVTDLNARLHSLRIDGVTILDADMLLAGNGRELRREYAADTLHFTPSAYQRLNRQLAAVLQGQ